MGSQTTCNGTLSADQFHMAANAFCDQWKSASTPLPHWTWIPCKRMHMGALCHEGYLSMESIYHVKSPKDHVNCELLSEEEEQLDTATMVQSPGNAVHIYDFHIAYSFSYRTPVLYFNGHQPDGQPLGLEDIQEDLPEFSQTLLTESKWTFITVEDHPYLHRPWCLLHPCGTSEWMKLLLRGSTGAANYLFSWLSVVGQAVGIRVPIDFMTTCIKDVPT